jgi:hypothetical protein
MYCKEGTKGSGIGRTLNEDGKIISVYYNKKKGEVWFYVDFKPVSTSPVFYGLKKNL